MHRHPLVVAAFLGLSLAIVVAPAAHGQEAFVRVRDGVDRPAAAARLGGGAPGLGGPVDPCSCALVAGFDFRAAARHAQAVPGGGTLSPIAFANPAMINETGRIAFIAFVDGAARNQGVFVVDEGNALVPIAMGCGGGGGSGDPGSACGDPSPIGGTFSGFFGGTVFAPPVNDAGDVLFIADVTGGSAPRGLFLYRAGSGSIVKIAAVGDPSPLGGTIAAVGPGSMNNAGEIVFLAQESGSGSVNILRYSSGALSKHVAVGDASPVGGTFSLIGRESFGFVDGTTIPIGAVPGINDAGQVSFSSLVSGGSVERGVFVTTGGVHALYAGAGQQTPAGGVYLDLQAAHINAAGDVAFLADIDLGGGDFNTGWFVGRPGNFRKAVVFFDSIAGGDVVGQAFSRNPIRALDDCGNLLVWVTLRYPDASEREATVVVRPDGSSIVVALQGTPTGQGGTFGTMNAWPAVNDSRQGTIGAGTPGTPGGVFNTQFVYTGDAVDPVAGTVNAGQGAVTDVFFVNGEARLSSILVGDPIAIDMTAAPAGPAAARYFFYAWATAAMNPVALSARGSLLGCLVNPTPFHPGQLPQPIRCVRGSGIRAIVCRNVTERSGPALAPFSISLPSGLSRPLTVTLQGVLQDAGAANATGFSVTNAVVLEID